MPQSISHVIQAYTPQLLIPQVSNTTASDHNKLLHALYTRERMIIGSVLDRGRFKWIGSVSAVMNDADRRCDKIHECGDKYLRNTVSGSNFKDYSPVAAVSGEACGRRLLA